MTREAVGRALAVPVCLLLLGARAPPRPVRPARTGVVVANWSPRPIREIYLSPATSEDWGPDRLEGRQVLAGDDVRLGYGGACRADLRVVFSNDGAEERHGVDFCAHPFVGIRPGWTTADDTAGLSPPALVTVRNRAGRTMTRLFLFADGSAAEGADQLGAGVLQDGADMLVPRPQAAACDYSLHVIFAGDGGEERHDGIDLCRSRGIIVARK